MALRLFTSDVARQDLYFRDYRRCLYIAAHRACFVRNRRDLARDRQRAGKGGRSLAGGGMSRGGNCPEGRRRRRASPPTGRELPPGRLTGISAISFQGGAAGQATARSTRRLRGLADACAVPKPARPFASDALMKLGRLGTISRFILMLAPNRRAQTRPTAASVKRSQGL